MQWYYSRADRTHAGPYTQEAFRTLLDSGYLDDQTLVWHAGLDQWQPLSALREDLGIPAPDQSPTPAAEGKAETGSSRVRCVVTKRWIPRDHAIRYRDQWVSPAGRNEYFQRIIEGAPRIGEPRYAGFWLRFAAKIIDGLIVGVVNIAIAFAGSAILLFVSLGSSDATNLDFFFLVYQIVVNLTNILIDVGYSTFFIGRFAATPGKMLFKMKVVRPDGSKVSYRRALGRKLAEWVSYLLLMMGYIMAAFDDEKRTLHDRMASTRVIIDTPEEKS